MSSKTIKNKHEKYLYMVFSMLKKRENLTISTRKTHFSDTELRLIAEVLSAKYEGRRLISTQIAKLLGVTRSAISQIVKNLEKEGVVKRVPDAVDRKIAYIEVTQETMATYDADLKACASFIGGAVERYGEEKFLNMCEMFGQFIDAIEEEKTEWEKKFKK